jgi:hypothetical protein
MRGGGGQPVQRRKVLFALQHEFRGGQCVRQKPCFLRDTEGVDGGEGGG